MRISFFEEYPTDENFAKLALIPWPSTIFIASPSLEDFTSRILSYERRYPHITFGWWPLLPNSYWLSGLANPQEASELLGALTAKRHERILPVLLDLELPRNIWHYLTNIVHLRANKRLIADFLASAPQYNLRVYTAEYPCPNSVVFRIMDMLGVSPPLSLPHVKLPMCYSSMMRKYFGEKLWNRMQSFATRSIQAHPDRVGLGLGVTATGVLGNEPLLTAKQLADDLDWAEQSGAREVCIFRLGGLNESYISVMQRYATQHEGIRAEQG
jgi:hypothetical protein